MNENGYLIVLGFVLVIHMIFAILSTVEIKDNPLYTISRKIIWLCVVWVLPFVGAIIFHKSSGLGWASGSTTGGDTSVSGYCDGDGGGSGDGGC